MTSILPILGSVEALLADVKNVRASEKSLKQLAALIDDEFRLESSKLKHMKLKAGNARTANCLTNAFAILGSLMKWIIMFIFILTIAVALFPDATGLLLNTVYNGNGILGYIFNIDATQPKYNISDISWYFFGLQILRMSSVSLHLERHFPVTDLDVDACVISNPLYIPGKRKCSLCKGGFIYGNVDKDQIHDSPVLRKRDDIKFNLARLQQVLQKNEMMMNQHTVSMRTNCDYIHTVEDLKDNKVLEQLENDNTCHVVATSLSYMSSHILRKDFPRPQDYFLAAQTSHAYVYLDGKNSSSYELTMPISVFNSMYIQCSGSRRLIFSPPDECHYKCQTFSRVMKTGDIVFYSCLWTVHSEATNDKSLAFVDTFDWLD